MAALAGSGSSFQTLIRRCSRGSTLFCATLGATLVFDSSSTTEFLVSVSSICVGFCLAFSGLLNRRSDVRVVLGAFATTLLDQEILKTTPP